MIMRTYDEKNLCNNLVILTLEEENTRLTTETLLPPTEWCYNNINNDHLWYSEMEPALKRNLPPWVILHIKPTVRYWFEHKGDTMLFKLIWKV
jgi:hypothetical protein